MSFVPAEIVSAIVYGFPLLDACRLERQGFQVEIDESRRILSTLDEKGTRLDDFSICHAGEQDFLRAESDRIWDAMAREWRAPPEQPHIVAALLKAFSEIQDDVCRLQQEMDEVKKLRAKLIEERRAVQGLLAEQLLAHLAATARCDKLRREMQMMAEDLEPKEAAAASMALQKTHDFLTSRRFLYLYLGVNAAPWKNLYQN